MQIYDYIRFARRWVPVALVLAVICGGLAYGISKYVMKPLYTGTATMQVDAGGPSPTVVDPTYSATLAQTYAAVAEQRPILRAGFRNATGQIDPAIQNRIIAKQSPSASCQTNGVTALFSCSVTANSASFAAKGANEVARAFIHQESVWRQNRKATVILVTKALTPSGPSSPHPTLNALVAFLLVFLLALGFGLVRTGSPAWLDNRQTPDGSDGGQKSHETRSLEHSGTAT